jgi:hypothetical protein
VIQSIWWHRQHCQAKSKVWILVDTISMLDLHTEVLPHGMNHGPRTSLAKSINGDTYSTVQDFATISSLKELNLSDCRFLQPKGSTGLILAWLPKDWKFKIV